MPRITPLVLLLTFLAGILSESAIAATPWGRAGPTGQSRDMAPNEPEPPTPYALFKLVSMKFSRAAERPGNKTHLLLTIKNTRRSISGPLKLEIKRLKARPFIEYTTIEQLDPPMQSQTRNYSFTIQLPKQPSCGPAPEYDEHIPPGVSPPQQDIIHSLNCAARTIDPAKRLCYMVSLKDLPAGTRTKGKGWQKHACININYYKKSEGGTLRQAPQRQFESSPNLQRR